MSSEPASSEPRGILARWRYAAKPASWPKLIVPSLFGQAMGLGAARQLDLVALALGAVFTVFVLLFIVFLNDWGDREVDAIKRRMFRRECSPKTIPDGILPAHHLLFAGIAAGALALAIAVAGQFALDRPLLAIFAAASLFVFVAYSLPPLRLNYRGGGELLEMLGVGVALPVFSAYLQGGSLALEGLYLLPGFALMSLAGAVASGLSDERSDRRGGKSTFVTRFGNRWARRAVEVLTFAGAAAWLLAPGLPWWLHLGPAVVALFHAGAMLALSSAAKTDAFEAQRRYKAQLHHGVWRGATLASMLLAWRYLL